MRTALFAIAALLVIGGAIAIAAPREVLMEHPGYRRSIPRFGDYVSKDKSVVYGWVSLGLGAAAVYAAISWKKWNAEEEAEEKRAVGSHGDADPS